MLKYEYEPESSATNSVYMGSVSRSRGVNDKKLDNSISRTRSRVFEIAICNEWDYFVTMTIDGDKLARDDLQGYRKKLSKFLNNYNGEHNIRIAYLLIPELHQDGINYHIHGLLSGLPLEHLTKFSTTDKLPRKIIAMQKMGRDIYTWSAYSSRFGYITLEKIIDSERCAFYITKYIKKGIAGTSAKVGLNYHLYYCSQNLNRAAVEYQGELSQPLNPDYENEYIAIKTLHSRDEAMSYFY